MKPSLPFDLPFVDAGDNLTPAPNLPGFNPEDPLVPLRGPVPLTREDDINRPQQFSNGYVAQLDMAKPDDVAKYNIIVNAAAHGTAMICREEVAFNTTTQSWIVFVRWMQRYYATIQTAQQQVTNAR